MTCGEYFVLQRALRAGRCISIQDSGLERPGNRCAYEPTENEGESDNMRKSFVTSFIAMVVVFAGLFCSEPGFGQAQGQGREICSPHGGRCLNVRPPNLPAAPPDWKMPRTRDGKPDFTGVYGGAGFNHQVGPNDTDTPIIRGFDGKIMPPTRPGGDAIL